MIIVQRQEVEEYCHRGQAGQKRMYSSHLARQVCNTQEEKNGRMPRGILRFCPSLTFHFRLWPPEGGLVGVGEILQASVGVFQECLCCSSCQRASLQEIGQSISAKFRWSFIGKLLVHFNHQHHNNN